MKISSIKKNLIYLLIVCILSMGCAQNIELDFNKQAVVLSAIKGEKSKVDTLVIANRSHTINEIKIQLQGVQSNYFKVLSALSDKLNANDSLQLLIQFQPDETFVGLANAVLILQTAKDSVFQIPLRGMSTKGLEGKNEPPLSWVLETLGYDINLGWTALANHIKPNLQGEELPQVLFNKSGSKSVEMIPVARYSPSFVLPFGYYTVTDSLPVLHEVGVLADSKSYPEHQTLFPAINSGSHSFIPQSEPFGFYTTSPSHVAYSEDTWNKQLFSKHATHACRIYALKNVQGQVVLNQFLVCFEEAFNGDYQDYVFLVKNVEVLHFGSNKK